MLIGTSHRAAWQAVARHLIARGYRRIGFVGARMDPRILRMREGCRAALEAAGHYAGARDIGTEAPSSVTLGRELAAAVLAADPATDAIFCANDDLALGVLFECMARGIAVPGRMEIVAFNDLEMMAAAVPAITSMRIARYRMGFEAIGMLLDRLDGRRPARPRVDPGFELIERASMARTP